MRDKVHKAWPGPHPRVALVVLFAALAGLSASCAIRGSTNPQETPQDVMTTFLQAFVNYDYVLCQSLLAPGATVSIVRSEGAGFNHAHMPAGEWLREVEHSGVKDLTGFRVEIQQQRELRHRHGATVTLKFVAYGDAGPATFENHGFDTGSLIQTDHGWRILHYSSFESFSLTKKND